MNNLWKGLAIAGIWASCAVAVVNGVDIVIFVWGTIASIIIAVR